MASGQSRYEVVETRQVGEASENRGEDRATGAAIAAWRRRPEDAHALAGVRALLLARRANAIQAGAGGVGDHARDLARSVCNLLDRIREGMVDPSESSIGAVADAAGLLGNLTQGLDDATVGILVERLDAYASGLTDLELEDSQDRGGLGNEPPLLTVRHDGVRVTPGSFDAASETEDLGGELAVLLDAWEAIAVQLHGQVTAVRAIDMDGANRRLRRLAESLQTTVDTVERLHQVLASYARRVSG